MATANVVQTSISGGSSNALALQGDGAFLPKLDTASRLSLNLGTPDKGLMVYDTTLTTICVWSGFTWEFISDNTSDGFVSVKDYGAVGDGVTDDTAAIQAAIEVAKLPYQNATVASVRSGTVLFPKGRYRITAKITIYPGMVILGESQESTHIVPEHSDDTFYGETPDGSSSTMLRSYSFRDISIIQKLGVVPTAGAAIRVRPQTITNNPALPSVGSRIDIRNVYIYGTYRGVHATAIQGGFVSLSTVTFCRLDGFLFDAYQTTVQINSSWASSNGQSGTGNGWRFEGPSYISLTGVAADSNANYGYYVTNSSEQSCYANRFDVGAEGNDSGGMFLQNQQSAVVTAFCLMDLGVVAQDGIVIDGTSSKVRLVNCTIPTRTNCTGFALKVTNGPTNGDAAVSVDGGFFGLFNGGANIVSTSTPINWSGYQSANRFGYGVTGLPSIPYQFFNRTNAAGTAGRELSRLSSISTDNLGSAKWTITCDNGTSFGEIEQNSLAGGPYNYSTTFADTIFRNTYSLSAGQFGNIKFFVGSAIALTLGNGTRRGQVAVGTQTIDASAAFQVSSTTLGFLPPAMTTVQKNAIASPAKGLMVYDTTLDKLCVYTTAWETITSV